MYFTYKGTPVYYTVKGGGENLLFLHGWGAESRVFARLIDYYKDRFNTIALDFPPFGMSGELSFDYTVHDYKDLTCALLEHLNIKKTSILCHSFGGRVGAVLAAENPELVEKAVFCASAGLPYRKSIKRALKKLKYKLLKKIYGGAQEKLKKYFSSDYNALPENMKKTFVNIINEDLSRYIKKVKCPAAVIWGRDDSETPLYMAKKYNRYIGGSRLKIINGGHYCFLDNFEGFAASADALLRNTF